MAAGPRWLDEREERAWRAYRRMQELLPSQLERDLGRDCGLSGPDYEVLSTVSEKPGHQWQLRELASKMLWSRSRLSHHITRMQQRGLVTRAPDPDDRRGCIITLSDEGLRSLEAAAPFHVASVREHFLDLLSEREVALLARVAERVASHLDQQRD